MRPIPQTPKPGQPRDRFDAALKERLETVSGERGGRIEKLETTASLAQVISKINELIDRLQA